jgi:hypothetical protein
VSVPGLLLSGQLVATAGITVVPPASHGGPSWNALHPDDRVPRTRAPSLIVLHTTGGHWPQPILPGAGAPGHARQILEMWSGADRGGGERMHSGAHLVVDFDGTVYCAADLVRCAAHHAQQVNARSVGIEMCTTTRGELYQATIDATARLGELLTSSGAPGSGLLPVPAQMPRGPYRGAPLRRLELEGKQTEGADLVGVIGHRDQTAQRGRGDPGDAIWTALAGLGFEGVDYDGGEDLELGRARQQWLGGIAVDGIVGRQSLTAARDAGFARWRDILAAAP